jgi:hypothetical protein
MDKIEKQKKLWTLQRLLSSEILSLKQIQKSRRREQETAIYIEYVSKEYVRSYSTIVCGTEREEESRNDVSSTVSSF